MMRELILQVRETDQVSSNSSCDEQISDINKINEFSPKKKQIELKESFNTEKFKDFGSFKPDNNLDKVTNNSNLNAELMI